MPFKAMNVNTGELIISLDFNSKLELIALHENVVCPYCKGQMHCRERTNFALHFVHNTTSRNCPSGGEGWLHLECKRQVYLELKSKIDFLPKNIKEHFRIDLELRVEQVNRIIDVALLLKNKPVEAHEVQLSPITVSELETRTRDYSSQGIAAYWYFGGKSFNQEIQRWSKSKYGEIRFFEFKND
jgi:competence CoiA-like predicted nuclease